jgi:hypothetical protein
MKDRIGKIFIYQGAGMSRCVICNVIFSRAQCRVHSVEVCFPAPSTCPRTPYGVMKGEA